MEPESCTLYWREFLRRRSLKSHSIRDIKATNNAMDEECDQKKIEESTLKIRLEAAMKNLQNSQQYHSFYENINRFIDLEVEKRQLEVRPSRSFGKYLLTCSRQSSNLASSTQVLTPSAALQPSFPKEFSPSVVELQTLIVCSTACSI
jgi:hypothetical protein